jgi:predicted acyltransferase (DUF342 family)
MNKMNDQQAVSGKKVYQEPRLRVYGDIRGLTTNVGMTAPMTDAVPSQKTV